MTLSPNRIAARKIIINSNPSKMTSEKASISFPVAFATIHLIFHAERFLFIMA